MIEARGDDYDQRVRTRIEPGAAASAEYYIEVLQGRRRLIETAERRLRGFDAFVSPTVAMLPPSVVSLDEGDRDHYSVNNLLSLRNTSVGNFLDTCSISIPATGRPGPADPSGQLPIGIMLTGRPLGDRALFAAARTVEAALSA